MARCVASTRAAVAHGGGESQPSITRGLEVDHGRPGHRRARRSPARRRPIHASTIGSCPPGQRSGAPFNRNSGYQRAPAASEPAGERGRDKGGPR